MSGVITMLNEYNCPACGCNRIGWDDRSVDCCPVYIVACAECDFGVQDYSHGELAEGETVETHFLNVWNNAVKNAHSVRASRTVPCPTIRPCDE